MESKSPEDIGKLKVAELKKLLKERSLPCTGTKPDLVKRLQEADAEEDLNDIDDDVLNEHEDDADEEGKNKENTEEEVVALTEAKLVEVPVVTPVTKSASPITVSKEPVLSPETKTEARKLSAEERLSKRAERFGAVSEDLKKSNRAARFGLPVSTATSTASGADVDRLKKRAERFGSITSKTLSKEEEKSKLAKRAERFGGSISNDNIASKGAGDSTKLLKRAARFGGAAADKDDIEAKKSKRAERFQIK